MTAKTLEAVKRHGEALLAAFQNAKEKDPVALCKKLRRIENQVAPMILKNCNEGVPENELDKATDRALTRTADLLGIKARSAKAIEFVFVNRDPRGCALKLSSEWTALHNDSQRKAGKTTITTDWGGYGLLAPDLTVAERGAVVS